MKKLSSRAKRSRAYRFMLKSGKLAGPCAWCGQGWGWMTVDHVIDLSKGGSNRKENLQVLCARCHFTFKNKGKTKEEAKEFAKKQGFVA